MTTDSVTITRLGEQATTHVASPVIDALEVAMMALPEVPCPLRHFFTPGLYCREITMPAGTVVTSKIHMTRHQFTISKGRLSVWTEGVGWVEYAAPFHGITEPGTRRVLVIHEDTIWTTSHPTNKTTPEEVEADIIMPHTDHLKGLEQPMAEAVQMLGQECG